MPRSSRDRENQPYKSVTKLEATLITVPLNLTVCLKVVAGGGGTGIHQPITIHLTTSPANGSRQLTCPAVADEMGFKVPGSRRQQDRNFLANQN
jgi:hypothetical protein